ncbi:MAG: rod shape-determining protein MreC [Rickettsiales bacterium]|jgi:rod shape-determining protein MreC
MFKHYLEPKRSKSNFFAYHNLRRVIQNIEEPLFAFLCLALIVTSKINPKITDNLANVIVEYSTPIARIASAPFNAVVDVVINFQELMEIRKRNIFLTKENQDLKSVYIKSLKILQENRQIIKTINYAAPKSSQFVVAHLIAKPHQIFSRNVFIDAGENYQIKTGNIVTGSRALVGRIDQVGTEKSRVLLATNINSRIPVLISGSKTKGILAGNNSDLMKILYLGKDHSVKIGDMVFTSGDGDEIPSGILVGVISKTDRKNAYVKMIEDVKNLDLISVINY